MNGYLALDISLAAMLTVLSMMFGTYATVNRTHWSASSVMALTLGLAAWRVLA